MKPKVMKVKAEDGQELEVCPIVEGWPLCINAAGEEVPFNVEDAVGKLKRFPEEKATLAQRLQQAEQAVAGFTALGDIPTLQAAIEVQKNLKAGQLMAAGEAQKVRDDAVREANERLKKMEADLAAAKAETDALAIGNAFNTSKLFQKDDKGNPKIRLKPQAIQALFGQNFRREADGTVAAYVGDMRVTSHRNIGDPADFDEALEILINKSIHKDDIWAGTPANGSGATGAGRSGGSDKSMPRAQFNNLSPAEQMEKARAGITLID